MPLYRIGTLESTSQRYLGIAGIVGAISATKGATRGFSAGIVLCLMVYGAAFFKGENDGAFSKDR